MESRPQFEDVDGALLVRAPAKINLSLLIAGKRADGYHEIETVMAKVTFYDEIRIATGPGPGVLRLTCQGRHWAPEGEDNLVVRAARAVLRHRGLATGLHITLTKNIPAGSGLGSASSDAASTLLGLDRLLGLGLDRDTLSAMAADLGSDVAFFLHGPLSYCTGRGEQVRTLASDFTFAAILILPGISVSTARVYANYRHDASVYGLAHNKISGYLEENRVDLLAKLCANMLLEPCLGQEQALAQIKTRIEALGIGPVCLSGSGSTLYCIIEDGDLPRAERAQTTLAREVGCDSLIVARNGW